MAGNHVPYFFTSLLYEAAWKTNWHNFKSNKRPILLGAFGLVLFTTLIVGVAAHLFIPGISLPLGFLLGAIVSPTDVVAATSITKGLHLSPKVITILEGESLVNDASSLVAYKYAVSAVMAGNFALVFDRKMMISINIWSVFDHDMINRL